jgi:hypothetical protein
MLTLLITAAAENKQASAQVSRAQDSNHTNLQEHFQSHVSF